VSAHSTARRHPSIGQTSRPALPAAPPRLQAHQLGRRQAVARVELTGGGSVVDFDFPPEGGPAFRLTVEGEEFRRVAP
jgi:hypothetical protein